MDVKRCFFVIILAFIGLVSNAQSLQISFTTVPITSGSAATFSPKHILAVWIETSDGKFVCTLKVMAQKRIGYLTNWNAISQGNKVDATTGATLSTHTSHNITWNCQNYSGTMVANGNYKLCIELTSGNTTGTYSETAFTVGAESYNYTGATQNASNLSLVYSASITTGISTNAVNNNIQNVVSIYPNPFKESTSVKFYTSISGKYSIDIYDQLGAKALSLNGISEAGENILALNTSNLSKKLHAGYYYCIVKTQEYSTSVKVLKQ